MLQWAIETHPLPRATSLKERILAADESAVQTAVTEPNVHVINKAVEADCHPVDDLNVWSPDAALLDHVTMTENCVDRSLTSNVDLTFVDSEFSEWSDSLQEETIVSFDRLTSKVTAPEISSCDPSETPPMSAKPLLVTPQKRSTGCGGCAPRLDSVIASPSTTKRHLFDPPESLTNQKRAVVDTFADVSGCDISPLRKSLNVKLTFDDR
jgi:hypothetical protein